MGRVKKGRQLIKCDLWSACGGLEKLIEVFCNYDIKKTTHWNSEVWTLISIAAFGSNKLNFRKWLNVVWTANRKGVRTRALKILNSGNQKTAEVRSEPLGLDHHRRMPEESMKTSYTGQYENLQFI